MSALRRALPAALMVMLLAALWLGAAVPANALLALPDTTCLRYFTHTFSLQQLQEMEKSEGEGEQPLPFSAFTQLDSQPVKSVLYGRSAQADILLFYGDLRQIIQAGMPETGFVSSADAGGCALDRETAFALWGSDRVIGEKLIFEEKEYTVRAIFDAPGGTVAIPISSEMGHTLSAISLGAADGQGAQLLAERFYERHGLPAPDVLSTGGWHRTLARFFCLLPALPLIYILLAGMVREIWGMRETPVLCALWSLLTLAVVIALLLISGVRLSFPQSLVPTRWSDFEFWSRLLRGFAANLRSTLLAPVLAPDRAVGAVLIRLLLCSLGALMDMCALLALCRRRRERG